MSRKKSMQKIFGNKLVMFITLFNEIKIAC